MVPANAQRQAHQDRSQGGQPFPLRDISDGGSGCAADALSGNPCPAVMRPVENPAVAFFDNTCEAGMMCGTAENRVLESRFYRERWRCANTVGKSGFSKYLLDFVVFFCEKTRCGGRNIVDIVIKLRYFRT